MNKRESLALIVAQPLAEPNKAAFAVVDAILDELMFIDRGICADIRGDGLQPIWDNVIGDFVTQYLKLVREDK